MPKTEVEFVDGFHSGSGPMAKPGVYPFFDNATGARHDIHCKPAQYCVGLTEVPLKGPPCGIFAVARDDGGIVLTLNADELRSFAAQLNAMAGFLDGEKGVHGRPN